MRSVLLLISLFTLPVAGGLPAQLPIEFTAEGRVGSAIPVGDFGSGSGGFSAEAGLGFAIGGRINPLSAIGIFAGYQRIRFGCAQCEALGLEDATILEGLEAGLHLSLPLRGVAYEPWIRGALLQQRLAFSGFGERLTSKSATGFGAAAGVTLPLAAGLHLSPGVSFLSVPAEFAFTSFPERSVDVTAFTFDIGVVYRF